MSECWQRVFTHLDPKSPLSESLRVLRSNIQFASVDKPLRTILITSTGPSEGKSTTTANLGVTLAQTGARVILVDTDLRRPTQHEFFRLRNGAGISTVLLGRARLGEAMQATEVEGLSLLPSGPLPPNPSEILSSEAFGLLLDELRSSADYILFDSPPAASVADTSILAAKVDGVLLVVELGVVPKAIVVRAKEQLLAAKANLLGIILTNVQKSSDYSYYYDYYYHHHE